MQSCHWFDFPEKLKIFLLTPVTSECMFCLLLDHTNYIDMFCIKLPGKFANAVIISVDFFLPGNINDAI